MIPNKPQKEFRSGSIVATIWKNKQVIDGKELELQSVQVQRRYQDKNKVWQKTDRFKVNDLPRVVSVAEAAFNYLTLKERGNQDIRSRFPLDRVCSHGRDSKCTC